MSELSQTWGRFTAKGSAEFEAEMTGMMVSLANRLDSQLNKEEYRALVLIGGYGRGEGGVLIENNQERAHNNLDLVLFTNELPESRLKELQEQLDREVAKFSEQFNSLPIDVSVMLASRLTRSTGLIIWYDMRFGHKTVLGDAQFVPSQTQFSLEKIPAWDARNLLINRGTLLLINDLLLSSGNLDESKQRLVIKHAIKAIIGYGDTLLFFRNAYHWSYVEKLKRIEKLDDVNEAFRALYMKAANFRFQADYTAYLDSNLSDWMESLRASFAPIMLECERTRLHQPELAWPDYPAAAFSHALSDDLGVRGCAKKLRNLLKNKGRQQPASFREYLGFKCLDKAGQLAVFFPLVAYRIEAEPYVERATRFFSLEDRSMSALRNAYLRYWGEHVDINFKHVINKYELDL